MPRNEPSWLSGNESGAAPAIFRRPFGDPADDEWTLQQFALAATSIEDLDAVLPDLAPGQVLDTASLRLAWQNCQTGQQTPAPAAPTAAAVPEASWSESFAPKLTSESTQAMKKKFSECYTSELLTPETMPSTRLLSLCHHQLKKQDFRWVPWKHRPSVPRDEEHSTSRSSKVARVESLTLHEWSDPCSRCTQLRGRWLKQLIWHHSRHASLPYEDSQLPSYGFPPVSPQLQQVFLEQQRQSFLIQSVACVQATFQAGGHGHLEQPANATTWLQPEIQSFLRITSASCVLPACLFGRDWARTWLLATSLSLRVLGGVCAHGAAAHSNVLRAGSFF